jgi:hypothetical protein
MGKKTFPTENGGHLLLKWFLLVVIPASPARRESFGKDSGQAGMTAI